MESVYILDRNEGSIFPSLLISELNSRDIKFSNIETTKSVYYNNIAIYIPKVFNVSLFESMFSKDIHDIMRFKFNILVFNNYEDFIDGRASLRLLSYGNNNLYFYQALKFDTLLASIIADDCECLVKGIPKFHNK